MGFYGDKPDLARLAVEKDDAVGFAEHKKAIREDIVRLLKKMDGEVRQQEAGQEVNSIFGFMASRALLQDYY